jgi:hypothetical protein
VPFIDLNVRCELAPRSARTSENVTKLDVLGVQESRIIECASRDCSNARNGLQRKPKVRTATRAKIDLQPSAGLVRGVAVAGRSEAGESDVLLLKHHLGSKCCASAALTP